MKLSKMCCSIVFSAEALPRDVTMLCNWVCEIQREKKTLNYKAFINFISRLKYLHFLTTFFTHRFHVTFSCHSEKLHKNCSQLLLNANCMKFKFRPRHKSEKKIVHMAVNLNIKHVAWILMHCDEKKNKNKKAIFNDFISIVAACIKIASINGREKFLQADLQRKF